MPSGPADSESVLGGWEISPEFVKKIEDSKLTVDDKVNLILTKAGFKPATELFLTIKNWDGEKVFEHMSEDDVKKIIEIVKESGLPNAIGGRKIVAQQFEMLDGTTRFSTFDQMHILIGRSEEELEALKAAFPRGEYEEAEDPEAFGKALGYPPTAVEAFVGKRERIDIKSLPKEVQESDAMLFSSPTLSADNWQEEIRQGKRNADFIRSLSPKIYEEMVTMMRKSRSDDTMD